MISLKKQICGILSQQSKIFIERSETVTTQKVDVQMNQAEEKVVSFLTGQSFWAVCSVNKVLLSLISVLIRQK